MNHTWTVGYNLPGCLPDNEPTTYSSFSGAKIALIHELLTIADDEDSDAHSLAAEDVNLWSPALGNVLQVNGINYWIERTP